MNGIDFIRPDDPAWDALLEQVPDHDFYHLPGYHAMAEARGEGQAVLCAYAEGGYTAALPLLLRPVAEVPTLEACAALDATSVYGYPGPIVSQPLPPPVAAGFQRALDHALRERNVVAVFSRLHPLLPQAGCLQGLGRLEQLGPTVSIDLRPPLEEQWASYRRNHKHGINKLRRQGVECCADRSFAFLEDFIRIYHQTMARVDAPAYYFFDRGYFDALRHALGERLHLYVCRHAERVVCAGLFVHTGSIVQYHLGGTHDDDLKLAPMKLLFDTVRVDFKERGAQRFHLGGGLGAQRDSLFHFKSGFGRDEHEFVVWKWVLQEQAYDELCRLRSGEAGPGPASFFPLYRR